VGKEKLRVGRRRVCHGRYDVSVEDNQSERSTAYQNYVVEHTATEFLIMVILHGTRADLVRF
jgi:hypothetical protein